MAGAKTSQGSSNPAAERIRENQRRSRARRKEFVEGMQRRLDEYEKQGVDATLQMQQAARTVAIENSRLRMLLARRGVSQDEIAKFLAMFETGIARDDDDHLAHLTMQGFPPAAATTTTTTSPSTTDYMHPQTTNTVVHQQQPPPPPPAPITTNFATTKPTTYQHHNQYHSDGGIDRLAVLADASMSDHCSSSAPTTSATTPSESTVAAQSPPSAGPSTMPGTPVSGPHGHYHSGHYSHHGHHHHNYHGSHHHPHHHQGTPKNVASDSALVMSCNTAAQIIAEMQGGALGGKGSNGGGVKGGLTCDDAECECFVKNTLLYQIMERNAA